MDRKISHQHYEKVHVILNLSGCSHREVDFIHKILKRLALEKSKKAKSTKKVSKKTLFKLLTSTEKKFLSTLFPEERRLLGL